MVAALQCFQRGMKSVESWRIQIHWLVNHYAFSARDEAFSSHRAVILWLRSVLRTAAWLRQQISLRTPLEVRGSLPKLPLQLHGDERGAFVAEPPTACKAAMKRAPIGIFVRLADFLAFQRSPFFF